VIAAASPATTAINAAGSQTPLAPMAKRKALFGTKHSAGRLFEAKGLQPVSLSRQIDQWSQFLEAMQSGSPSITSTADQMAEEMPSELVDGVKPTTRGTGVLLSGSPSSLKRCQALRRLERGKPLRVEGG
jgi:hypothetical protein